MSKITDEIYQMVKMEDVLRQYGLPMGRGNRIPCPLHGGKDRNFSYTKEVFHCWTCGAKGNVIGFVMQYFGITFNQAIMRINNDFSLGLAFSWKKPTIREIEDAKMDLKMRELCREHEKREREHYQEKANLHRILFGASQRAEIDGLSEYLDTLEGWLDQQLERKGVSGGRNNQSLVEKGFSGIHRTI